jgi:hypothetical protein
MGWSPPVAGASFTWVGRRHQAAHGLPALQPIPGHALCNKCHRAVPALPPCPAGCAQTPAAPKPKPCAIRGTIHACCESANGARAGNMWTGAAPECGGLGRPGQRLAAPRRAPGTEARRQRLPPRARGSPTCPLPRGTMRPAMYAQPNENARGGRGWGEGLG